MQFTSKHSREITAADKQLPGRTHAAKYPRAPRSTLLLLLLFAVSTSSWARRGEVFIYQFDLGKIEFDEEVFEGDTAHIGIGIAYALTPQYEIGFNYNTNLLFSASIDGRGEIDEVDDVDTDARLLYLRRYWTIGNDSSLFAQLGYARTEVESEELTRVCLFFCGEFLDVEYETVYRNKDTGFAWGLGFEHFISSQGSVALSYVDYAQSDFTGWHLAFRSYW